jgi:hypothetical protein
MRKTFVGKSVVILHPKNTEEKVKLWALLDNHKVEYLYHKEGEQDVIVLFTSDWMSIPVGERELIEGQLTR